MQIYSEDFVVLSSASAGRLFCGVIAKIWFSVNVVYQWKGNSLQVFFKSFGRYIEISRIRAGDSFSGILFPSFATLLVRIKTILNTYFIQPAFILDTAHAFIWNRPTLSRSISLYRPHGNNLQILFQDTSLSRPSPLRCHHLASVLSVDLYPLPSISLSLKEVYLSNVSGPSSPLLTILACNAEMAETLDRFLPFFILKV